MEENIFKKTITLVLAGTLMHTAAGLEAILAASNAEKQAEHAGQVKTTVSQLGVGAEVMVMLKNEPSIRGKVQGIEDENFLLSRKGDARPRSIRYAQVNQVNLAKLSYRGCGAA